MDKAAFVWIHGIQRLIPSGLAHPFRHILYIVFELSFLAPAEEIAVGLDLLGRHLVQDVLERLSAMGEKSYIIGEIVERKNSDSRIEWL